MEGGRRESVVLLFCLVKSLCDIFFVLYGVFALLKNSRLARV